MKTEPHYGDIMLWDGDGRYSTGQRVMMYLDWLDDGFDAEDWEVVE